MPLTATADWRSMPGVGQEVVERGLPDAFEIAAEIGEQRLAPRRTDARHVVQLGARLFFTTQITVIGDGESMGPVANALDEAASSCCA